MPCCIATWLTHLPSFAPRQDGPAGLLELRAWWRQYPDDGHREYSQLMSSSLALISDHILDSYPLNDYQHLSTSPAAPAISRAW
jgi:hypothetical protein